MSQSPINFTNKPSKQYPLDDGVWKQKQIPSRSLASDQNLIQQQNRYQSRCRESQTEPQFLQYLTFSKLEDSLTINNYTVRSLDLIENQNDDDDYSFIDWKSFKLV